MPVFDLINSGSNRNKRMDVIDAIKNRRSVRKYTEETVSEAAILDIIEAGRWAPSGLNNQPWKLKVVRSMELRKKLAGCAHYGKTILNAPVCIAVFLDASQGYDRTKDTQSIGACIQNMLLAAHAIGLGAVWLGEILKNRGEVEKILAVPNSCELMALIALGFSDEKPKSSRKPRDDILLP
jgi:nitroreductase